VATQSEIIDYFHAQVAAVNARMEEENQIGITIARRTNRIIKGILVLLTVVAVLVLFMINNLSDRMVAMTHNMVSMYENFGRVSNSMGVITGSVTRMNNHVRSLPDMKDRMILMRHDMQAMDQSVQSMHQDLGVMDQNLTIIAGGVGEMAGRFDLLTRTTQGMGHNVNQMSQPVRTLDPFGFFGR
jgi:methyl-accepting chemotaxis protein